MGPENALSCPSVLCVLVQEGKAPSPESQALGSEESGPLSSIVTGGHGVRMSGLALQNPSGYWAEDIWYHSTKDHSWSEKEKKKLHKSDSYMPL